MASMTIRDLDPARDAEGYVALILATIPTAVISVEEWRHRRTSVPERAQMTGRVAEIDGRIVGAAESWLDFFGTRDMGVQYLRVHPEYRNRGIGGELYELAAAHLHDVGARRVITNFDESDAAVAFARARGWREVRAETLSGLDPRTVAAQPDPSVEIRPARELDPRELHRVDEEATRDMPQLEPIDAIRYDEWLELVWRNPLFTRDGSFGALVDGELAAVSFLVANTEAGRAFNMFTGTTRAHRGRGLAYAVKLATTQWAAANGITQIVTTNDETNAAMLAVNRKLGYVPLGRRVEWMLELRKA